jgi:hypothetical protein
VQDYVAINDASEGTSGNGWALYNAQVAQWIGGTSEQSVSGQGVYIDSTSARVLIQVVDIEANGSTSSGCGINDNGIATFLIANLVTGNSCTTQTATNGATTQIQYNNLAAPYFFNLYMQGPATEPTGSCTGFNGFWAFSQDAHISTCVAGTWVQKL